MPNGVCVVWASLHEKPSEVVCRQPSLTLVVACGGRGVPQVGATHFAIIAVNCGCGPLKAVLVPLFAAFDALLGAMGGDVRRCLPIAALMTMS
jgi:predicted flavoprotein YhiN